MTIPLVSNVAFTEVTQSLVDSNSGVLNDIAGTAKSKLPVQYFKLNENISGNLTLNNDSAHQKIILDTNSRTLLNSTGSPLTQNSSTSLELKGSGNIQSTLKTSTASNASESNSGVTNFDNSNTSKVDVDTSGFDVTFNENFLLQNEPFRDKFTGPRTADNIPSGETFLSLTGTNGANITALTAAGFSFNNTGTLATGATGAIGSFQFYRMTNPHRTRSDMPWLAYFWTSTGM